MAEIHKGIDHQVGMVMDLNQCLGCHTCSMACKNLWTESTTPQSSPNGREYMYWNNVETKPGKGYPRDWEGTAGGFESDKHQNLKDSKVPSEEDYGELADAEFNYKEALFEGGDEPLRPEEDPQWGPNWDEDQGAGEFPNSYYFYLPRICNHCTHPACLEACPRKAIYKRKEDGIVLVDQERCRGYRYCVEACPYKKVYYNVLTKTSEKCIFCYPRLEGEGKDGEKHPPACATQCPPQLRYVGYLDDKEGPIYKLVEEWGVALPLHPEYRTQPNVYYIPPFITPPKHSENGETINQERIPREYLRELFGDNVDKAMDTLEKEREKVKNGGQSDLMDLLTSENPENFKLEV